MPEVPEEDLKRVRMRQYRLPHVSQAALENITLGVRSRVSTQSRGNRMRKHPQEELRKHWEGLSPFSRTVLCLLSEYRCVSVPQAKAFFTLPTGQPRLAYESWLDGLAERYATDLPADRIFTVSSPDAVYNKLQAIKKQGLIDSVKHAANNLTIRKELAPALLSVHYFLTELGVQVLHEGSGYPADLIGFVPNYENYAFANLLHLTESNDFFFSTMVAAQDLMNNAPDAGVLDVNLWLNERESQHKFEIIAEQPVTFKPDGLMVLFSSMKGDFIDFYLEYDRDTDPKKIQHKASAFLNFVLYSKTRMVAEGEGFRRPLLLFVTPTDTRLRAYQENIRKAVLQDFRHQVDYINAFGRIALTTASQIKEHSPLGDVWQVLDLRTGGVSRNRYNLLTIGW